MFEKFSKGGIGLVGVIAFLVVLGGQSLGIPILEADATVFAQQVVGVIGFVMMMIGQFTRKDLIGGLKRRGV